eukprot:scaffold3875_cov123-Cylindrotheca_fusiformis.AAC.26
MDQTSIPGMMFIVTCIVEQAVFKKRLWRYSEGYRHVHLKNRMRTPLRSMITTRLGVVNGSNSTTSTCSLATPSRPRSCSVSPSERWKTSTAQTTARRSRHQQQPAPLRKVPRRRHQLLKTQRVERPSMICTSLENRYVGVDPLAWNDRHESEFSAMSSTLGEGAFSTVKEGSHRQNGESFAIKIVLEELKHKHIIRLYDVFEEPQYYYLVTEKMMGGELFDRIVQKSYYNEKEARDVCLILFDAMKYCHDHKVAHRDLKPENLLLSSESDDSNIKIADFGFAKKVKEPNSLTTQCGTPGYVAPEILEGKSYDTQADMWSLGVIVYILLGGYPPFIEQNQRELFRKIRKGQYEFHEEYWGQVSDDAKNLIRELLTVSPSKRYDAAGAMKNSWIGADASKLANQDLGANLEQFRKFNAKRKFKAAVKTVVAANKLQSLGIDFKLNLQ